MKPRFTAGERAVLIALLLLVAGAAMWRWWKIHALGIENADVPPGITRTSQNPDAK